MSERINAGTAAAEPIITAPVDAFSRMSGISRDLVYDMLKQGSLESIKIGRKRLIVIASYHRYIEDQLKSSLVVARRRRERIGT